MGHLRYSIVGWITIYIYISASKSSCLRDHRHPHAHDPYPLYRCGLHPRRPRHHPLKQCSFFTPVVHSSSSSFSAAEAPAASRLITRASVHHGHHQHARAHAHTLTLHSTYKHDDVGWLQPIFPATTTFDSIHVHTVRCSIVEYCNTAKWCGRPQAGETDAKRPTLTLSQWQVCS